MRISDWSSDVCSSDLHAFSVNRQIFGGDWSRVIDVRALPTGLRLGIAEWIRQHSGIQQQGISIRSAVRCVGKECVCTFRLRLSLYSLTTDLIYIIQYYYQKTFGYVLCKSFCFI